MLLLASGQIQLGLLPMPSSKKLFKSGKSIHVTKIGMTSCTGFKLTYNSTGIFFSMIKMQADEFEPLTHLNFKNSSTYTYQHPPLKGENIKFNSIGRMLAIVLAA